jgi:hypothetical protein
MTADEIVEFVKTTFDGVDVVVASEEIGSPEICWGDIFFIYDPDRNLPEPQRFPFATIVKNDYPGFDEESRVSRDGIYRLNIGVGKTMFSEVIGRSGSDIESMNGKQDYDFSAVDVVLPHPVYFAQSWVCILNPSPESFPRVSRMIEVAYGKAVNRVSVN